MSIQYKCLAVIAALTLTGAPAVALAHGNPHRHGTPGWPKASPPAHANAYGFYCRKESRKHVAGEKGTPFSKCVTDMAKLATGKVDNPARACKDESKKHVAGQKGTPFSQCVRAAAHMKKDKSG
jgi:hypothetical protein